MPSIKRSGLVPSQTKDFEDAIPTSGKDLNIILFEGDAAFTKNAMIRLVWKHMHATETAETLWTIKGSTRIQHKIFIPKTAVDGVRKLAVVCDNGEVGSLFLSGYVEWIER